MLLLFSEINKINKNYFDFRFEWIRSKLCTKRNYGNGDLSGIRFSLHANETWGEIALHPVELFTFRNSEFRHKHDFYMPPTRQIKQTKTASTHDWERIWNQAVNSMTSEQWHVQSQCPGFASYGHRARGPANWHWLHSQHAMQRSHRCSSR